MQLFIGEAPPSQELGDSNYFNGGQRTALAYMRIDNPGIPLSPDVLATMRSRIRTFNFADAGLEPYSTKEGELWTSRVYTTLDSPDLPEEVQ